MPLLLFRCPVKALKVEWVDCEGQLPREDGGALYKVIVCPACARLHFVNQSTGDLLGEN